MILNAEGKPFCGLNPRPAGAVCAGPYYEVAFPNNVYTDSEIKAIITDPDRVPRRVVFKDTNWIRRGDQKNTSGCNGWAAASAYSKTRWLRGIQDGTVFSGSYIYSRINDGQDNGSSLDRGMAELGLNGTVPADECPADFIYRNQTSQFDEEAAGHVGLSCYAAQTQQGFKSGIAAGLMGIVAVQVAGSFQDFRGPGILPAFSGPGNHAIHCDDLVMRNGTLVYNVANNYGIDWGEEGKAYVTWDSFDDPFRNHVFYLVGSTNERGE